MSSSYTLVSPAGEGRPRSASGGSGSLHGVTQRGSTEDELDLQKRMEPYSSILENAITELEEFAVDCWGGLVFVIVADFPAICKLRGSMDKVLRVLLALFAFSLNLGFQSMLLFLIYRLLMMPAFLEAQNRYKVFHQDAFVHGEFDPARFAKLDESMQASICELALAQKIFVRVVLFLWVISTGQEFKDTMMAMWKVLHMPRLPAGMDARLLVTEENKAPCLNCSSKAWLVILVYIPKCTIAMVLMLSGSFWLMASESIATLILNSLALAFVTSVDELIAEVFFPSSFKAELSTFGFAHPKDPHADNAEEQSRRHTRSYVYSFVSFAASWAVVELIIKFQPVIPYYAFDVHRHCEGFLNSQYPWCMPWQNNCFPMG